MNALKKALTSWWFVSIAIAVLLAVALILLAPMVIGFLRPWWVRLIVGLVILAVWGGLTAWHVMTAKASSDALVSGLEAAAGGEGDTLATRMKEALASLKTATGKQSNYLYSRPWFVIIGPPGAGKTTALVNSGLRFPFSDTVLKGAGGTRNLDFWFADEAVFVDTAGRYTSQDSSAERDASAWNSFLGLLKKNRPTQPINGVLVAMGVDTLMAADTRAVDEQAGIVRRRVQELQSALEISVPVYVVFTKADLVSGFVEFFEDLDVDGRRAVLGATFTYDAAKTADEELLVNEFDDMAMALEDRVSKRLQDDLDAKRRSLIVGFPSQVGALRSRVIRFLAGAFPQTTTEEAGILRGFYFASGVQSGTPFDRLLGDMASLYDQRPQVGSAEQGRAYFINRLLTEVVVGEGGLMKTSKKGAHRAFMNLTAWLIGIGAACALVFLLWMVSFFLNQGFQGQLFKQTQAASAQLQQSGADLREARAKDAALTDILPALQALRDLPQGYGQRHGKGAPFFMTFGLYQQSDSHMAQQTYLQAVDRTILPRVLLRLEDVLHDPDATPLTLYPALKTYLLLGGQGPKMDAADVKAWIDNDYANGELAGPENDDNRKQMDAHLDAMLADPNMNQVWANGQAPLDAQLIHDTRMKISSMSLVDRAYSIMVENATNTGPDWRAAPLLDSGSLNAFANPSAIQGLRVPFFYTRDGFKSDFNSGLVAVATKLKADEWVLGADEGRGTTSAQMGSLKDDLSDRYAQDYIAKWEGVIQAIQPANYFGNSLAQSAIASENSPLKILFLDIRKNTAFEETSGDRVNAAATNMAIKKLVPGELQHEVRESQGDGANPSKVISDHFKDLNEWVGSGLDPFIQALKDAIKANSMQQMAAAAGGQGADGAAGQALAAQATLKQAAQSAPPMAQGFTQAASTAGSAAQISAAQTGMAGQYNGAVASQCQLVTANHYPFSATSTEDASLSDMRSMFGSGGTLDSLVKTKLAAVIDSSGPIWHWRADQPVAQGFSPTSAENLQTATQIRDFLDSGIQGTVELAGVGGSVKKAEFAAGPPGQTYTFDPAAPGGPQPFQWSVPPFQSAHVRLIGAGGDVKMITTSGPWALLRLIGQSQLTNSGPVAMIAQFGDATNYARFRIVLNGAVNPFRRGGLWSFRCPPSL